MGDVHEENPKKQFPNSRNPHIAEQVSGFKFPTDFEIIPVHTNVLFCRPLPGLCFTMGCSLPHGEPWG